MGPVGTRLRVACAKSRRSKGLRRPKFDPSPSSHQAPCDCGRQPQGSFSLGALPQPPPDGAITLCTIVVVGRGTTRAVWVGAALVGAAVLRAAARAGAGGTAPESPPC